MKSREPPKEWKQETKGSFSALQQRINLPATSEESCQRGFYAWSLGLSGVALAAKLVQPIDDISQRNQRRTVGDDIEEKAGEEIVARKLYSAESDIVP